MVTVDDEIVGEIGPDLVVFICAMRDDTEAESDETNNTRATSSTIDILYDVDLVVTAVTPSVTSIGVGGAMTFDVTVQNVGTTSTRGTTNMRLYRSDDNIIGRFS